MNEALVNNVNYHAHGNILTHLYIPVASAYGVSLAGEQEPARLELDRTGNTDRSSGFERIIRNNISYAQTRQGATLRIYCFSEQGYVMSKFNEKPGFPCN